MKKISILSPVSIVLTVFILSLTLSQCTSTKEAGKLTSNQVKDMIDSSRFVFVADRVIPLRGRQLILTTYYDVIVKKDSLVSYLPYFGRAYQPTIDPTKGGLQFSSTNFSYKVNDKGKTEWEIFIKPADYGEVQQLYFNIFDNGSATLNILNTHRDPISFDGHIERVK